MWGKKNTILHKLFLKIREESNYQVIYEDRITLLSSRKTRTGNYSPMCLMSRYKQTNCSISRLNPATYKKGPCSFQVGKYMQGLEGCCIQRGQGSSTPLYPHHTLAKWICFIWLFLRCILYNKAVNVYLKKEVAPTLWTSIVHSSMVA